MENLKKIIIILLIIIIAISILIISLLSSQNSKEASEQPKQTGVEDKAEVALVENREEFVAISNKISEYLKEDINAITKEDVYSTEKMYYIEKSSDFSVYYICGLVSKSTENGKEETNIYNILMLDRKNMTYVIMPSEKIEQENMIYKKINEYTERDIVKNGNNTIQFTKIPDENMSRRYLAAYKSNMLFNPEKAYDTLDKEYREKRFGSLDNFKQYIDENRETIDKITLQKHTVNKKEGYTEYIIIDNNYNYYIFKETAIMQYNVIADIHTINLEEFTKKYNSSEGIQKVGMNIEKIMDALNSKDYKYVYSKLADSYKNKNFPTFESFEEYAKDMFGGVNSVTYLEYDQEGENYLYRVFFKDITGKSIIQIEKTIIMRLEENYDFIFSFNLDNDGLIDENPD